MLAFGVQGCSLSIPQHDVGNWVAKTSYLQRFDFEQSSGATVLNSCSANVSTTQQCSGRGYCATFNSEFREDSPLSFCLCERDYADPECRTKRKSQAVTYVLAIFLGPFGADYFYLGLRLYGILKLATLGGCGLWWIYDIVRTGSGPIYASDFRVAADLPYWAFVLSSATLFLAVGLGLALGMYLSERQRKRDFYRNLQAHEEAHHFKHTREHLGLTGGPRFSGYGAVLPKPLPNASEPFAVPQPAGQSSPPFAGPYGPVR